MKKVAMIFSTLALLISISPSFAAMRVDGRSSDLVSDVERPFEGTIKSVTYLYQNNEPTVAVGISDKNNKFVQIIFQGADLPVGASLFNLAGKPLVVEFSDANFSVSNVFTYADNSDDSKAIIRKMNSKV